MTENYPFSKQKILTSKRSKTNKAVAGIVITALFALIGFYGFGFFFPVQAKTFAVSLLDLNYPTRIALFIANAGAVVYVIGFAFNLNAWNKK